MYDCDWLLGARLSAAYLRHDCYCLFVARFVASSQPAGQPSSNHPTSNQPVGHSSITQFRKEVWAFLKLPSPSMGSHRTLKIRSFCFRTHEAMVLRGPGVLQVGSFLPTSPGSMVRYQTRHPFHFCVPLWERTCMYPNMRIPVHGHFLNNFIWHSF